MENVKYFEAEISLNWKVFVEAGEQAPRTKVYCKASPQSEGVWTVAIVASESNNPFMMLMKDVDESFFMGVHEILPSYYVQQVEFLTHLCK